jgi:hypothetical protein
MVHNGAIARMDYELYIYNQLVQEAQVEYVMEMLIRADLIAEIPGRTHQRSCMSLHSRTFTTTTIFELNQCMITNFAFQELFCCEM